MENKPMSSRPSMWSRVSLIGLLGIVFSIVMLITAHTASWASTTPMVAGGADHTIALKSDGTVWAWGENGSGRLGDGTTSSSRTPVQVSGLSEVTAIAGGDSHAVAMKSDGTVWAWGYNYYGQ